MCSNDDLKELEIGMGPRKKLTAFITSQGEKIRAAKVRGGGDCSGVEGAMLGLSCSPGAQG